MRLTLPLLATLLDLTVTPAQTATIAPRGVDRASKDVLEIGGRRGPHHHWVGGHRSPHDGHWIKAHCARNHHH